MKKILLSLSLLAFLSTNAQNQYNYGFNGTTADLTAAGWQRTNQSQFASATAIWTVASYVPTVINDGATPPVQGNPFQDMDYTNGQTTPAPVGQDGTANSFALVNFRSTNGAPANGVGVISNWLITPSIEVQNGDVVSFYTRIGKFGQAAFADRLQLRMSTNGDFTVNPAGGSTNLGDFTVLLADVNPNLNLTDYPTSWGLVSATISGLTQTTSVKFAFRYFVDNGGPGGANSDIIGIDTFSVDRTLSSQDFFASNYAVFPNPADNVLNVSSKNNVSLNNAELTDINGRIVKSISLDNVTQTQINIADLTSGVYFLKVSSNAGVGTSKIVKK